MLSSKLNFTPDIDLKHELDSDSHCSLNIDTQILQEGLEQIFEFIWIFMNLQMNIRIYLVVQKPTNIYPNIFLLGKGHEYEYE